MVGRFSRQLESFNSLSPAISRSGAHFYTLEGINAGGFGGFNFSFTVCGRSLLRWGLANRAGRAVVQGPR